MHKYKYIVSLGYFCSPAMEFERINRRQFSLPFDWLITPNLSTIIELIDNDFKDFLNEEYLFQLKDYPQYYRNVKYNIDFYHDFTAFKSLNSQIGLVKDKYNRRIKRFYDVIKQPILFVRYITNSDVEYLSKNYDLILQSLKKFNPDNNIVFVANNDITPPIFREDIPIYYVEKDLNDGVARKFLNTNIQLKEYILANVEEASIKSKKKKNKIRKLLKKVYVKVRLKLKIVYRHNNKC